MVSGPKKTNPVFLCSKCKNILVWKAWNQTSSVWYYKFDYGAMTLSIDGHERRCWCRECQQMNIEPKKFENI
jgi:hypothetical protein